MGDGLVIAGHHLRADGGDERLKRRRAYRRTLRHPFVRSVEPAPYRVRAWKDGRVIVDSRNAKVAFADKPPNFWLFPKADVTAPADAITLGLVGLIGVWHEKLTVTVDGKTP